MTHAGALGPEAQDMEARDARGFPKTNSKKGRAGWEPTASASHCLQDEAGLGRLGGVTEKSKVDWFQHSSPGEIGSSNGLPEPLFCYLENSATRQLSNL